MITPMEPAESKKPFCFMQLKAKACVKGAVDKRYRADYRCDQCLWRIRDDSPEHLARMEKLYARYQKK
jgi:hypothetical protein